MVRFHKRGNIQYTNADSKPIEIIFITIPFFTISGIWRYPEPKTTALGGVATGSIKAHEAATAVATIRTNGCMSILIAMGAKTGSSIAVVAKLEVISVKKFTTAISRNIKRMVGNS